MACCVAVRNNRTWCWESGLKSISDTVISSLPPPVPFQLPPTPTPSSFRVLSSVSAKKKTKPSLFFTWIGSGNQLKILSWRHVIISCLSSVLPSTLPSYKPCSLLGAHACPRFGYSQEILPNFPYAAPCRGLLGQVSCCCCCFEGLQDLNHDMTD